MAKDYIVDTNVPLGAVNTENSVPISCQQKCVSLISSILNGQARAVIDDKNEAIKEYRNKMYPDPNPSAPIASWFLMYILTEYREDRVLRLPLTQNEEGHFTTYPDDPRLASFDLSDKKWIALAKAYEEQFGEPVPIVNATDSDWLHFEKALKENGLIIELLCREILKEKG